MSQVNPGSLLNPRGSNELAEPVTLQPEGSIHQGYPLYNTLIGGDEPSLRRYIALLRKRAWAIIACVVVVLTVSAIQSFRTPKTYAGTCRISINRENADPLGFKNGTDSGMDDWDFGMVLDTQVNVLNSDTIALQVIRNLHLERNPEFAGPLAAEIKHDPLKPEELTAEQEAELLGIFKSGLKVSVIPRTRIVEIEYSSTDPKLAAQIANAVGTSYIEHNFRTRFNSTMQTSDWLSKQLAEMELRVGTAQEKLVRYQKENGILGIDEKQNIVTEKLDLLNKELSSAEADRMQKEAAYRMFSSGNPQDLKDERDSLLEKLRARRAELSNQYAQLTTQFGPAYPKVIELKNQLQELEGSLKAETERTVAKIRADYLAATQREELLRRAFEEQKKQANILNERAIEYNVLKRDVETSRQIYEGLLQKLKEAGISAGLRSNNIQIVDSARVPLTPVAPNIPRNLRLALAFGLVGGIALAFVLESLDNTVSSSDEAQEITGLPALGMIPLHVRWIRQHRTRKLLPMADSKTKIETVTLTKPNSDISESYKALRTSILLSSLNGPPKLILVTSPLPREGKTATSVNTALVVAQKGARVLLVDTDLRRPNIHNAIGIENNTGLSTVLTGGSSFEGTVVRAMQHPNLDVLPAGPLPPHPSELLSSHVVNQHLEDWCRRYDFVILDSPPVLAVTDAVLISVKVDAVLLVVRAGQTSKNALRRARNLLGQVGARVMGIVVNGVNMKSPDHYYNYFYGSSENRQYYSDKVTSI